MSERSGVTIPWQAMGVMSFLFGHLFLAIWFASGVRSDVSDMAHDLDRLVNQMERVVETTTINQERIKHVKDEVDRLRQNHDRREDR